MLFNLNRCKNLSKNCKILKYKQFNGICHLQKKICIILLKSLSDIKCTHLIKVHALHIRITQSYKNKDKSCP